MSKQCITVIRGDGIGPSIVDASIQVLNKLDCNFQYEFVLAGQAAVDQGKELIPEETILSIKKNKIALKGPLMTPIGDGFTSVNVTLRKIFDLYANLRPAISFPNTKSVFSNVDIITVRQNTEGMYSGIGHKINDEGTEAEATSVVTKEGCRRIARFAFETARSYKRKKVTIVHKANILKTTSGLFFKTAREVSADYSDIECNDLIVDNCCMQLVMNPHQFDVIVTTNLLGDIISDLCAGLVGGLGMTPGANIGDDIGIFEAVHGSAPDIAGKNIANPCSLFLASAQMLNYLGLNDKARNLVDAIRDVLMNKNCLTPDLGGTATTTQFTDAVISGITG